MPTSSQYDRGHNYLCLVVIVLLIQGWYASQGSWNGCQLCVSIGSYIDIRDAAEVCGTFPSEKTPTFRSLGPWRKSPLWGLPHTRSATALRGLNPTPKPLCTHCNCDTKSWIIENCNTAESPMMQPFHFCKGVPLQAPQASLECWLSLILCRR